MLTTEDKENLVSYSDVDPELIIMKITVISKYPPIEGGVSSRVYWLCRGLGERGHHVHVVTNASEVEAEYRGHVDTASNQYEPQNAAVHTTGSLPHYIPYTNPYAEKIASVALDVVYNHDCDVIDSWYMLPYVISGYLVKVITGKPQILRHAGSDLSQLLKSPYLRTLFAEIFKRVDKVVTTPSMKGFFVNYGVLKRNIWLDATHVNTAYFNPRVNPFDVSELKDETPVITYIGKIGPAKGIFDLTEALSKTDKDFILLLVCGGKLFYRLKKDLEAKNLFDKTVF